MYRDRVNKSADRILTEETRGDLGLESNQVVKVTTLASQRPGHLLELDKSRASEN